MSFNPDSSPAYSAYLVAKAKLSDGDAAEFDQFVIKAYCQQADLAAAAVASTIVAAAKASTLRKSHTF